MEKIEYTIKLRRQCARVCLCDNDSMTLNLLTYSFSSQIEQYSQHDIYIYAKQMSV